eukprot:1006702-Prymnesium_polylepis.1
MTQQAPHHGNHPLRGVRARSRSQLHKRESAHMWPNLDDNILYTAAGRLDHRAPISAPVLDAPVHVPSSGLQHSTRCLRRCLHVLPPLVAGVMIVGAS